MGRRSRSKASVARLPTPVSRAGGRWTAAGVCLALAAVIWVVFGQTLGHEFIGYDDGVYVFENPEVAHGLTLHGIIWAFTHVHSANWHPLTWISHMLDCQLYGLNPGGHHLTNVLLHMATAILLFLVLRRMTGFLWRSAFVAAVFAIHPLRVESVAWVAERKDVLSGVFFMLTIGAYVRYVQPLPKVQSRRWFNYGLVLVFFALGLLCKPMLVTLPFVLLLLDYWPLNRFTTGINLVILRRLVLEKLPLFGLAAASGVVTIFAQTEAIQSFEHISLSLRVGNALISYVIYLGQMFWPSGLAIFYPLSAGDVTVSRVVLSVAVLAGISTGAFALRRRRYYLTGWLWYLIMLAPVIGILQVGSQAHADRYTYLPEIGLYVLLTWAAADLSAGWRYRRMLLGGGATVVLAVLMFGASAQTVYWRNNESLWTHALACTSDNFVADYNLGLTLLKKGDFDGAIVYSRKALKITPNYADAHINLGNALLKRGDADEAIAHYQTALQINPHSPEFCYDLGSALLKQGKTDEAIKYFQRALQLDPDDADACNNLGAALLQKDQAAEAIRYFRKALQLNPNDAKAHNNLGAVLLKNGNVDEAILHFKQVLQLEPDYAEAACVIGKALLQKGNVDEAILFFQKALQINPGYTEAGNNLAWALETQSQASLRRGNKSP